MDAISAGKIVFAIPGQIEATHFSPPAALQPYVTQIYHFHSNESGLRDAQPAALGQLIFIVQGKATLQFQGGPLYTSTAAALIGPGMGHAEFNIIDGPFETVGLALSPIGFAALTGKSASAYVDQILDASDLLGSGVSEMASRFQTDRGAGTINVREMIESATDFLQPFLRPVSPDHIALIRTVSEWISSEFDPDVEGIFARIEKSRSTATRLIRYYFGASPKQLMRKYRALRAAIVLVDPQASSAQRDRVESLFYDQPHMIREIRHFTGRTPGVLGSNDSKMLRIWLSKDNFRQLESYPG